MKAFLALCTFAALSLSAVEDMVDLTAASTTTQEEVKAPLPLSMPQQTTNVYLTNQADHEVGIEWSVSLSDHYKMNGYERVLPAKKDHMANDRFTWLVDEKEAGAHPVYMINVTVYNELGGRKVVAKKSVQRTLSPAKLHGAQSPTNLHITYKGPNKVTIALM